MNAPIARFLDKTVATSHGLIWIGTRNSVSGYGQFHLVIDSKRHTVPAHRYWYEANNGPLDKSMDVHHTCHIRVCLTHLAPVERKQNRRDQMRSNKARRYRLRSEQRIYLGAMATTMRVVA